MAILEETPPIAFQPLKTCDFGLGLGATPLGESSAWERASGAPPRMRGQAKRPSSTAERRLDRGGALRRPCSADAQTRETWTLSKGQMSNLVEAAHFAAELGIPLNRFVTINWEAGGVANCIKATGCFLKSARDWLRRRGRRMAYVWVQERGDRVGQHVHMLIHVPADLARRFSELQRRWLRKCGASFHRGLIKSRSVGPSYRAASSAASPVYRDNLRTVLDYMLKQGASAAGRPPAGRSLVLGKRCTTSENIGVRARKRASAPR